MSDNAEVTQLLARAISEYRASNFPEASRLCAIIVEKDGNNIVALHLLAVLEAQKQNSEQSLQLFDRALKINPNAADILADKGKVLTGLGQHNGALLCYQQAISINPKHLMALHNKACTLLALKRPAEALSAFDRLLEIAPNFPPAFNNRGVALNDLNRYDEAITNYKQAISFNPQDIEAWCNLGDGLFKLKRFDEALAAYDKALALLPNLAEAWLGRGNVLFDITRYDEAFSAYDKAIAIKPGLADAWLARGNAFFRLKRYDEAFADCDKALALRSDLPNAWLGRGNAFFRLKRHDEAFSDYDKALALKPDLADAWLGRGNVFLDLRRYDEALAAYDKAFALKPDLAVASLGRANVLLKLHRYPDAAESYEKLLELEPDHKFARGQLLHAKMLCCDWRKFNSLADSFEKDLQTGKASAEPFGYQAIASSAQELKLCAEIYAGDKYPRSPNPLWRGERYNNKKIRIGYLSGEFRNHVTTFLMTGMYELHDKTRFELFAFDNGWDDGGDYRGRINKAFDAIIDIGRLNDQQAAAAIKQQQIDILVNLNGYFGEERTGVFANKPAPIQVNYLGFTATMGADYIDYIIADRYVIPPEQKSSYTENVVYLPDTYQVNDTKRPVAQRAPTRTELQLPETGFVFCCFSNNFKITPDIFGVWMRLLNNVNDSVLWLPESNPAVSRNLRSEAKSRGVAPDRVVFAPIVNYPDYLARYQAADLFLDTLPFNAGATASDALWAGLPLVTCSGQPFTARMAGSLLNAIGLPELITQSLDEYEALALKLAHDPALLASIKAKLATNRDTYPLFDTARCTRHIEAAYTIMWERYQRGQPPEGFAVDP